MTKKEALENFSTLIDNYADLASEDENLDEYIKDCEKSLIFLEGQEKKKQEAFKIIQNMQVDYFYRLFDEIHNDKENEYHKQYSDYEKKCDEAMELLK